MHEEQKIIFIKTLTCGAGAAIMCSILLKLARYYGFTDKAIPFIGIASVAVGIGCGIGVENIYEHLTENDFNNSYKMLGEII